MEKEIKLSFFKRLKMSIFDFDKYHMIAGEGLERAMMYLVKIVLIFSLIMSLCIGLKVSQIINEATNYIKQQVPNFQYADNTFSVDSESDVIIENHKYMDFKIILTNSENYDEATIKEFDGLVIVMAKNKMFFKQENGTSIITQTYQEVSEMYGINELNKETFIAYFHGENRYTIYANIFAVIFISVFITYFMTAILNTIALSLLGYIVSRIIRIPLKYASVYSMSTSAITLPIIINLLYMIINLFTGFVIPYFQIMYTLVSYVYLVAALLIMKSEIIKKKIKIQFEIMNKQQNDENEIKKEQPKEDNKDKNSEEEANNQKKELKDKVDGKINNKKDDPEPQVNIQEK